MFGVSIGSLVCPGNQFGTPLNYADVFSDIAALGCTMVRYEFNWQYFEPAAPIGGVHTYVWTYWDALVAAAQAAGLSTVGMLMGGASWATSAGWVADITSTGPFAVWAAAAAARYQSFGCTSWEIWNEPNLKANMGGTASDATKYTTTFNSVATMIHAAVPTATVIAGALSGANTSGGNISPTDFMTTFAAGGGLTHADAISVHPYSWPKMASTAGATYNWNIMFKNTPSVQSILAANGHATMPIWITEYGAPTGGYPGDVSSGPNSSTGGAWPGYVTENYQAQLAVDAVTTAQAITNVPVFLYDTDKDLGTDPNNAEDWFGLRRYDGSPKPAWTAYADAIQSLTPTPYCYSDIYRFRLGAIAAGIPITFYNGPVTGASDEATMCDVANTTTLANPQTTDADGELIVYSATWPLWYMASGDTERHYATCVSASPAP